MQSDLISARVPGPLGEAMELRAAHYKASGDPKATFFCLPGGGMTRRYFDLGGPYSFVERMTSLGYALICADHVGIGENSLGEDAAFTPRDAARVMVEAIPSLQSAAGVSDVPLLGLGHSMGGFMTALIQGGHSPYAAIALLGAHAGGLDWGLDENEKSYANRPDALEPVLVDLARKKFGKFFFDQPGPSENSKIFGGENAGANDELRKATAPVYAAGGLMSMIEGSILTEAQAVRCPIFFAFGDNDIGRTPYLAPKEFTSSPDIRLIILPSTGHNSFAFASIDGLCEKLDKWAREVTS
ncbi:MAG: alpha/beta hydrolase [Pseudomonadota bacterium]